MANEWTEGLKKLFLAGVGAVADTAEKSEALLDRLVKKGEISVEQGRVLNEELKRTVRDGLNKRSGEEAPAEAAEECACECAEGSVDTSKLTTAQKRALLDKLTKELASEDAE